MTSFAKTIAKRGSLIGTILMCAIIAIALAVQAGITISGTITGINVQIEDQAGVVITQLTGVNLSPGTSIQRTIYVENTGVGYDMTLTHAETGLPSYLTLSWNYVAGTHVVPGPTNRAVVIITITASASAVVGTAFSFNMAITGTQV